LKNRLKIKKIFPELAVAGELLVRRREEDEGSVQVLLKLSLKERFGPPDD